MATATRRRSTKTKKTPALRARSQTTRSHTPTRTGGARGVTIPDPLMVRALLESFEQLSTRVASLERLAGMRPALEHAAGDGGSPK
jgi:hypothetical protein